jgi:hypothetical protein
MPVGLGQRRLEQVFGLVRMPGQTHREPEQARGPVLDEHGEVVPRFSVHADSTDPRR